MGRGHMLAKMEIDECEQVDEEKEPHLQLCGQSLLTNDYHDLDYMKIQEASGLRTVDAVFR